MGPSLVDPESPLRDSCLDNRVILLYYSSRLHNKPLCHNIHIKFIKERKWMCLSNPFLNAVLHVLLAAFVFMSG